MRRLVESWIEAERAQGRSLADAIRFLNQVLGSKVTHSRVSEWRRGIYVPTPAATSLMLIETLPWALRQAGLQTSPAEIAKLKDLLWNTRHEGGEVVYELY